MFPEGQAVLTNFSLAADGVYVQTLDGGVGRLFRIPHGRAAAPERIALPFDGAISFLWSDGRVPGAMLIMQSWASPPLVYDYDPARRKLTDTGLQPRHPVDMSGYESCGTAYPTPGTGRPSASRHRPAGAAWPRTSPIAICS